MDQNSLCEQTPDHDYVCSEPWEDLEEQVGLEQPAPAQSPQAAVSDNVLDTIASSSDTVARIPASNLPLPTPDSPPAKAPVQDDLQDQVQEVAIIPTHVDSVAKSDDAANAAREQEVNQAANPPGSNCATAGIERAVPELDDSTDLGTNTAADDPAIGSVVSDSSIDNSHTDARVPLIKPKVRDKNHYLVTVVFEVENTLFRVPVDRLKSQSMIFKTMYKLPDADTEDSAEGASNANPIVLKEVGTAAEFAIFLDLLCPREAGLILDLSVDEWVRIFRLATVWLFIRVREIAILKLHTHVHGLNPIDRMFFAKNQGFGVSAWFINGAREMVVKSSCLTEEGCEKLGLQWSRKIFFERERCWASGHRDGSLGVAGGACQAGHCHDLSLRELFATVLDEIELDSSDQLEKKARRSLGLEEAQTRIIKKKKAKKPGKL